jgi:hypothetical protein
MTILAIVKTAIVSCLVLEGRDRSEDRNSITLDSVECINCVALELPGRSSCSSDEESRFAFSSFGLYDHD